MNYRRINWEEQGLDFALQTKNLIESIENEVWDVAYYTHERQLTESDYITAKDRLSKAITTYFDEGILLEFLKRPSELLPICNYITGKCDYLIGLMDEVRSQEPDLEDHINGIRIWLLKLNQLLSELYSESNSKYKSEFKSVDSLARRRNINEWNVRTRFELLDKMGVISRIQQRLTLERDKSFILSQIMGCNDTTARKLLAGRYPNGQIEDEFKEITQLLDQYNKD